MARHCPERDGDAMTPQLVHTGTDGDDTAEWLDDGYPVESAALVKRWALAIGTADHVGIRSARTFESPEAAEALILAVYPDAVRVRGHVWQAMPGAGILVRAFPDARP